MSNLVCKQGNDNIDSLLELHQSWNNRLQFPLSELNERYLRGGVYVRLECSLSKRDIERSERFALTLAVKGSHLDQNIHRHSQLDTTRHDGQLPMFIESVHIVNDTEGLIESVVPAVVRLEVIDQSTDIGFRNPLYVSLITGKFIFVSRPFSPDREQDCILAFNPVCGTGEMPRDVIQARPEMMNDLSAQNTETDRSHQVAVVVNSILPFLRVFIGDYWVSATFKESDNLLVEITDILIGPC